MTATRTYTYTKTVNEPCGRCGHARDDHRHDDTCIPDKNGHDCNNPDVDPGGACPFRCVVGPTWNGQPECDCPDYIPREKPTGE